MIVEIPNLSRSRRAGRNKTMQALAAIGLFEKVSREVAHREWKRKIIAACGAGNHEEQSKLNEAWAILKRRLRSRCPQCGAPVKMFCRSCNNFLPQQSGVKAEISKALKAGDRMTDIEAQARFGTKLDNIRQAFYQLQSLGEAIKCGAMWTAACLFLVAISVGAQDLPTVPTKKEAKATANAIAATNAPAVLTGTRTIAWDPTADLVVKAYEFVWANNAAFAVSNLAMVVASNVTNHFQMTNLDVRLTYYIRVRSYDGQFFSEAKFLAIAPADGWYFVRESAPTGTTNWTRDIILDSGVGRPPWPATQYRVFGDYTNGWKALP